MSAELDVVAESDKTEEVTCNKRMMRDLHVDDDPEVIETESLCMNCHENGMTRLLATRIPFFREVMVSSFSCEHCHWSDTSLMPLGEIQDLGVKITVRVEKEEDFDRSMAVMSTASITIPEIALDIPPSKGTLTTVEGVLQRTADDLEYNQNVRRIMDPETAQKIDDFIAKLRSLQAKKEPFTMIVKDPSGNSFVQNPDAPKKDERQILVHYRRSKGENASLGLAEPDTEGEGDSGRINPNAPRDDTEERLDWKEEIMSFRVACPNCKEMTESKMKPVSIPHFKDVIIMATSCDNCGVKENEVKSGGGIEPKGRRITLRVTDPIDMSRDVLKSDMCALEIPELGFESQFGMIGGKFTTVEGLLNDVKDQLYVRNPFFQGDSADAKQTDKLKEFCERIDQIIAGERMGTHIILDDPSGNSYLQSIYSPQPDPELLIVDYERTFEQNEDMGLNDMVVDP